MLIDPEIRGLGRVNFIAWSWLSDENSSYNKSCTNLVAMFEKFTIDDSNLSEDSSFSEFLENLLPIVTGFISRDKFESTTEEAISCCGQVAQ